MSIGQNALTLTQTGIQHNGYQIIKPDYTGIFAFCGTIFVSILIGYVVIYKISIKFKETWAEIQREKIKKECVAYNNLSLTISGMIKKLDLIIEEFKK